MVGANCSIMDNMSYAFPISILSQFFVTARIFTGHSAHDTFTQKGLNQERPVFSNVIDNAVSVTDPYFSTNAVKQHAKSPLDEMQAQKNEDELLCTSDMPLDLTVKTGSRDTGNGGNNDCSEVRIVKTSLIWRAQLVSQE